MITVEICTKRWEPPIAYYNATKIGNLKFPTSAPIIGGGGGITQLHQN